MTQATTTGDARSARFGARDRRARARAVRVRGVRVDIVCGADRFGWFVYEAGAWLLLLFVGPFLPVGRAVLVGALFALGLEAFAFYRAFVLPPSAEAAAIYLWKPLAQPR